MKKWVCTVMTLHLLSLIAHMNSVCPASIKNVIGVHSSSRKSNMILNALYKIVEITKNFAWMKSTNTLTIKERKIKAIIKVVNYLSAASILKSKLSFCVENAKSSCALFACLSIPIIISLYMFKQIRKFWKIVNS